MPSVLIANRGEIALRVLRAARALGWRAVAVKAAEEADGPVHRLADEVVVLAGERPYLDADQLVAAAERAGCELLHPGYGFLSESAALADGCEARGIRFVGPEAAVLRTFGDKGGARQLAEKLGVPVLRACADVDAASEFLAGLGPGRGVMVKAVAGGGGRGMRRVLDPANLAGAIERCRSEALRAFGDDTVFVEELVSRARHVEVQIVGDGTGAVSHVWDRECSLQRRQQKVVEVAPARTVPEACRERLRDAAVRMTAAVSYRGLCTVEFLVDADDPARFAFLEANPRIQVEHTVTEAVTGLDLVAAQLRIAAGATLAELGLAQDAIPPAQGTAVQCRVNAEELRPDGAAHATAGRIEALDLPGGPGVRVDTAAHAGEVVTTVYDSLLAKIITHVPSAELAAALDAARSAVAEVRVEGLRTNVEFLRELLAREEVRQGRATTSFVDEHLAELVPVPAPAAADGAGLAADFAGTVVFVADPGARVAAGDPVVVLEAMKMEHVLAAPYPGEVRAVRIGVGDLARAGQSLVDLIPDADPGEGNAGRAEPDPEEVRPDLEEVVQRHRIGLDEARPEAVAKRRRSGHRTARENIADLCDDGSFLEYGALVIAAQRQRRTEEDLIANTPADGMVTGIGTVNAEHAGDGRCVVLSYDYTVLAGTQGFMNHEKTDRMLDLAARQQLPVVLFAEGGGGRPGDTDVVTAGGLDLDTFAAMGRLNGLVPTVGIAAGRCFAGNAALLGVCDVVIATADATIGMGGPAMIEGGGLGVFRPEEVGPVSVQEPNGVLDLVAADEAEAVDLARRYLSYFQGDRREWTAPDQRRLRHVVPENRVRVYDVRRAIELLADDDSVLELRRGFGAGVVTALVRIEGRPMGLIANNPRHLGGAIDADAADKTARFLQLCDAHGLPVVSLVDTPGFMVGPDAERTATVRKFGRMFVAGGHLDVPMVGVVLRKAYGLGAMAMVGGGFRVPAAMVAWPSGEVGGMGLEGAVRLGYRRELDAIADHGEKQREFDRLLAESYQRGKALAAAAVFEMDDVIDPADTRRWITRALPGDRPAGPRKRIDTW
ncbi:acetyl-CoA carboxylase family protein [Amycolatopsis benzoatilytica]|uniref:acetyl-CoA carboxylase family protein n=1 Tax=Amycolatopsis benzoatilytica TaxID=346045 RepID=UPI0003662816|nr:carboxyl transferase domain-containing protein [Amycolatopsis benzoatilytica]